MPVYAIDQKRDMLVEFKSEKALEKAQYTVPMTSADEGGYKRFKPLHYTAAHNWVKRGYIHETGLYIDDGRIRYAKEDLS